MPIGGRHRSTVSVDIGAVPVTRDNRVSIPSRTLGGVGARYRFRLTDQDATLRVQVSNVYGLDLQGAGAYDIIPGRVISAYMTFDFRGFVKCC